MDDDKKVDLPGVEAVRETTKALLCYLPAEKGKPRRELWIPKSAIHDDSEVYDTRENNHGKLVVHEWFAEKEKLI